MNREEQLGTLLRNETVTLEPADPSNVEFLIQWTLDPVAQGPYKRVPDISEDGFRTLFLHSPDRWYFLIRTSSDSRPLGRFYYRKWQFHPDPEKIDWELNIFIADPGERGKGYGTSVQALAMEFLLGLSQTHSVFAYTMVKNTAERRSLQKAGFEKLGRLPSDYYRVDAPPGEWVLYARKGNQQ
ncbi:MAG: GNAT family N-acetyltransferase [Candidatus Bipolaricaulia bacterium]